MQRDTVFLDFKICLIKDYIGNISVLPSCFVYSCVPLHSISCTWSFYRARCICIWLWTIWSIRTWHICIWVYTAKGCGWLEEKKDTVYFMRGEPLCCSDRYVISLCWRSKFYSCSLLPCIEYKLSSIFVNAMPMSMAASFMVADPCWP